MGLFDSDKFDLGKIGVDPLTEFMHRPEIGADMLGMGALGSNSSGGATSGMSPEERELIQLQTLLLGDAVAANRSSRELQELLTPILLEEAGYTATRATADVINPEYTKAKKARDKVFDTITSKEKGKYFARASDGTVRLSKAGRESKDKGIYQSFADRANKAEKQLRSVERYSQRVGDITSLSRVETPAENLREENEQLLLERQNSALRGELPVNPALLSSLDEQEEELKASLLENLGTGFETSTPGIEALANFEEKKQAILEASRRDDIASAGGLANELGGFMQGLTTNRFNQTGSVLNAGFGAATNLSQIVQGYSSPLSFLQNSRGMDLQRYQIDNQPGMMEAIMGQAGGAAAGYGLMALFCDRRLKTNIEKIGELSSGIAMYVFEYVFAPGIKEVGPMADEVAQVYPDLVKTGPGGYLMVDLGGLI